MKPRIHDVLDGTLPASALDAHEAAQLAEGEAELAAVLRAIPSEPIPDLSSAVMTRLAREGKTRSPRRTRARPLAGLAAWLWRRRHVELVWRPAYALGAAAIAVLSFQLGQLADGPGAATAPGHEVLTRFVLEAPRAHEVRLAGEFTEWAPAHVLARAEPGVWSIVIPLAPGVHEYAFLVDGERWVPDPNAPAVSDGFGGLNSRLAVLASDEVGR